MPQDEEGVLTVIELMKTEHPNEWKLIYSVPAGVAKMPVEAFRGNGLLAELCDDIEDETVCLLVADAIANYLKLDPEITTSSPAQDLAFSEEVATDAPFGTEIDGITPDTNLEEEELFEEIEETPQKKKAKKKKIYCPAVGAKIKHSQCAIRRIAASLILMAIEKPSMLSPDSRIPFWQMPVCEEVLETDDGCEEYHRCLDHQECENLVGEAKFSPPSFQLLCETCRLDYGKNHQPGEFRLMREVFPDWWKEYSLTLG